MRPRDRDDTAEWGEAIADALIARHEPPATVEILGGRAYADPVTPALERRGFDVIKPLRGLGIGERQSRLDSLVAELANEEVVA
jgi:hypothetical protein